MSLAGRTLFITGASRGIGLAIALKAARQGANIAIAAKTSTANAKLPGTIYTAADEIEKAGGQALPLVVDVREESMVKNAIAKTVAHFGHLDIVVNNASAISLSTVEHTEMRRFDLMHQVNARGAFMVSKYAIPHLLRGENPHILMISPPLDMQEKWFAPATGYAMAKFGMSLVALGLAGELRPKAIAVNTLWPRTTIATAAVRNLLGGERMMRRSRSPEIMAEAACRILQKPAYSFTGRFLIDDSFLAAEGITDFDQYRIDPSESLALDFFVPADPPQPHNVSLEPATGPHPVTLGDDDLAGDADAGTEVFDDGLVHGVADVAVTHVAVHAVAETVADRDADAGAGNDRGDEADSELDGEAAIKAAETHTDEHDAHAGFDEGFEDERDAGDDNTVAREDDDHDDDHVGEHDDEHDDDHDDGYDDDHEDDGEEDTAYEPDARHATARAPAHIESELDAALAAAIKEMTSDLSDAVSEAVAKATSEHASEHAAEHAAENSSEDAGEETDPTLKALEQQLLGRTGRRT